MLKAKIYVKLKASVLDPQAKLLPIPYIIWVLQMSWKPESANI